MNLGAESQNDCWTKPSTVGICWDIACRNPDKDRKKNNYSKKHNSTFGPFLGSLYISSSLSFHCFHWRNGTATVYPRGRPVVGSDYRQRPLRCATSVA